MKVRPLHDRVVVKRLEEEQKTKGGIIIPDTAAEKPQTGKVVSIGAQTVQPDDGGGGVRGAFKLNGRKEFGHRCL